MFNKKGLSDIVTNVLIILLVLVAVTIIWFFLQPTIRGGAGQLGGASDCITIQLEPVSCVFSSGSPSTGSVKIKRNPGEGALGDVRLVFETASGNEIVEASSFDSSFSLDELESWSPTSTMTLANQPLSFSVAAVVDSNGNLRTCSTSTPITCSSS